MNQVCKEIRKLACEKNYQTPEPWKLTSDLNRDASLLGSSLRISFKPGVRE